MQHGRLNEAQIVNYCLPRRRSQDDASACPLIKPLSPSRRVYSSLMRRILLSLHCPSPPSALHHSLSCDLHPSCPLASPGPVALPVEHSDYILNEWNVKPQMNDKIWYLPLEVWDFFLIQAALPSCSLPVHCQQILPKSVQTLGTGDNLISHIHFQHKCYPRPCLSFLLPHRRSHIGSLYAFPLLPASSVEQLISSSRVNVCAEVS